MVDRISIGVQAEPRDIDSWLALARRLEAAGFDALLMGDHPGSGAFARRCRRGEAGKAGRQPAIEALVHMVTVTDDRDSAAAAQSSRIRAPVGEIRGTPFALMGTPQEMAGQLLRQADELGISRCVIREAAIGGIEKVLPLIRP